MFQSFDFEIKLFLSREVNRFKYRWCQQMARRKSRSLPKLFFIKYVHPNFFIRYSHPKVSLVNSKTTDYATGYGLISKTRKCVSSNHLNMLLTSAMQLIFFIFRIHLKDRDQIPCHIYTNAKRNLL